MVNRTETKASEIAEIEAKIARIETAQFASSMSNSRYYTDGSKARDDAEISAAKDALNAMKKDQD
jgi:hypothetical protein